MKEYALNVLLCFLLVASISKSSGDLVEKAIAEINLAPDWREIRYPNDGSEGRKLLDILMRHVKCNPEEAREIVKGLVDLAGVNSDLKVGAKIYLFNRLYCNVSRHSKRDGWKVFGGWGGIAVDEHTFDSLFPLVPKDEGFSLEQFSGYGGPPYQGLEEFDWLLKRFGQRYKAIAAIKD